VFVKYLIGAVGGVLVLLLVLIVGSYTGFYNVSAEAPHTLAMTWFLDNTKLHSVRGRARVIRVPQFTAAQVQEGREHFREMCIGCHGAPGIRGEGGGDMRPEPPPLLSAASRWNDAELFWILRNGIKMSGMPSFGASHNEAELWSIVALLRELRTMTPEQYARDFGRTAGQIQEAAVAVGSKRIEEARSQEAQQEQQDQQQQQAVEHQEKTPAMPKRSRNQNPPGQP